MCIQQHLNKAVQPHNDICGGFKLHEHAGYLCNPVQRADIVYLVKRNTIGGTQPRLTQHFE